MSGFKIRKADAWTPVSSTDEPKLNQTATKTNAEPAPSDILSTGPRTELRLDAKPAPGARPTEPDYRRTLWLGTSGGSTGKLGDAETYASGARLFGLGGNWLASRYPGLNENFFYRFAELATSAAVEMPWMIYNHELGHASVARQFGWETDVDMTGWLSGHTRYTFDADGSTTAERFRAAAGGVNRSTSNAEYMAKEWSRNGATTLQEAVAYLGARVDLANYLQKTVRLQENGAPISADNDIAAVERLWRGLGKDFSSRQLLTVSLASHLLSTADWAALFGAGRFLATGDRELEMPTFELGGVSLTPPQFSTYLTTQGPLLGGSMTFNPDRQMPVEIDFAATLDGSAFSAGAKVYDLPVLDGLTVNPFIGVSQGEDGLGYRLGAEARWDVSERVSVKAVASFNHNDLMTEAYGQHDGINVALHLGVRF